MSLDASVISIAIRKPEYLLELQQAGVDSEMFVDDWPRVWNYITRMKRKHETVPSMDMIMQRFNWVELGPARRKDMPILLNDLRTRRQHTEFINALVEAVDKSKDFDTVGDVMQTLQGRLNEITARNGRSVLKDLFSRDVTDDIVSEIKRRRSGQSVGLPTGLNKLDFITGGMQRQRMITVIGRPGLGKSWLDLLFVASAVKAGGKFILYPLEMTLYETAFRLYTIFTQTIFGGERVLKNFDLSSGTITPKKVIRLLHALEDKFEGQLYVADVGSMSDPYTPERIEAEVELLRPDGFWVDYITLMKVPKEMRDQEHAAIRQLSHGIKTAAQRQNCIGGCSAQVNRDALKQQAFIPRLENIAYGDSIGQDADQVISINRKGKYLFYGLVKNRHGPEFGRVRVKFFPNEGIIIEDKNQEDEDA